MTTRPVLQVDLAALGNNYSRLQRQAGGAEVAAVVKADAYGLGAARVAPVLQRAGARRFCVADAIEGCDLRSLVDEAEILILGGYRKGDEAAFADARLTPALNTLGEVARYRADRPGGPAALMVDTGMTRLGVHPNDLGALAGVDEDLDLRWVMSHLACADAPAHTSNQQQLEVLHSVAGFCSEVPRSFANSSGLFLGSAYRFAMARPGIALYGGNPTPDDTNPMQPVVHLEAPILQVHEITEESVVGYGATYRVGPGARIATVAIGYADGLLRSGSNAAKALVAGVDVPVAGRVSMDLLGLDVSAVGADVPLVGMPAALIWGPDGVDRLAAASGTIPYEVLVRLGPRVERRYQGEAAA